MKRLTLFWKRLTAKPGGPRITVQPRGSNALKAASADASDNNFTPRAVQVLALARTEARRLHHHFVGTEHVLLGLVALGQGKAVDVLQESGVKLDAIRAEIEMGVGVGLKETTTENIRYTPRVKKVLALAAKQARALNHACVGTEHLLLGLLAEGDGVASRVLMNLGLSVGQIRDRILAMQDPAHPPTPMAESSLPGISAAEKPKSSPVTAGSMPPRSDKQPHYVLQLPTGEAIDTSKRYDVYCTDLSQGVVVYRSARFRGMKHLFQRSPSDPLSGFVELEQVDGQLIYISRSSIVRFCAPGTIPGYQNVPGQKLS